MTEPSPGKEGREELNRRQTRFGEGFQEEAEDQIRDEKWADGDDSGQDIALQTAQRVADGSFHVRLPFTIIATSIPGSGETWNVEENTKTVSNRRKISYIWGLPSLFTAGRIP
jgi:hypothetical protein